MITTAILQTLFNCSGSPLAESVLLTEVRLNLGKCGEREFQSGLARLRLDNWATSKTDELTGDTLWSITKKGTARITGGR
jgi:hypothetical protein